MYSKIIKKNQTELILSSLGESRENSDDETAPERRKILVTVLLLIGSTQLMYMNVATFLPPYRLKHHPALSDTSIGLILS